MVNLYLEDMMSIDFMMMAIQEAKKAMSIGEVPVGAVIIKDDEVIAAAHNLRETHKNPLSHAEILAIDMASKKLGGWRLEDCDMYVTLEPCLMCAGAIYQSRIKNLYYGATDLKSGAVDSLYHVLSDSRLNHQVNVISGVHGDICSKLLKDFFGHLRSRKSKTQKN